MRATIAIMMVLALATLLAACTTDEQPVPPTMPDPSPQEPSGPEPAPEPIGESPDDLNIDDVFGDGSGVEPPTIPN